MDLSRINLKAEIIAKNLSRFPLNVFWTIMLNSITTAYCIMAFNFTSNTTLSNTGIQEIENRRRIFKSMDLNVK
jgi:hypothetical protein